MFLGPRKLYMIFWDLLFEISECSSLTGSIIYVNRILDVVSYMVWCGWLVELDVVGLVGWFGLVMVGCECGWRDRTYFP